jgi:hypothetical protein
VLRLPCVAVVVGVERWVTVRRVPVREVATVRERTGSVATHVAHSTSIDARPPDTGPSSNANPA